MLYIFRRRNSTGARDLAEGIMMGVDGGARGIPARRTKGQALRQLTNQDQVICWGDYFAPTAGVRTLNNVEPLNKFGEAQKLNEKGVATVKVSRTQPRVAAAPRPAFVPQGFQVNAGTYTEEQLQALLGSIQQHRTNEAARRTAWAAQPAPVTETWLPRSNRHVGGNDLLAGVDQPDFFSKKENIVEEYRVHMFKNKSIRAGKKVQRPTTPGGTPSHQWIRSFDAGWIIQYDGFQSTKPMRKLARQALNALGLDFGAVDLGKTADNHLLVLEVNRAPGVEGGTVESYAKHIINWVRNPQEYEQEEE